MTCYDDEARDCDTCIVGPRIYRMRCMSTYTTLPAALCHEMLDAVWSSEVPSSKVNYAGISTTLF